MLVQVENKIFVTSNRAWDVKAKSVSSRFQPGEGPSRGLLRDYEPLDAIRMQLFEAQKTKQRSLIRVKSFLRQM